MMNSTPESPLESNPPAPAPIEGASSATDDEGGPSPARAVVCLLLNVIVFPGLGTLVSGDRTRRRTGFLQLGFGAGLVPVMILIGLGTISFQGTNPEVVQAWLSNFMLILVIWNVITGVQIFRDSWKKARAQELKSV